ncbi:SGNH/GDSL hydrolase family protein [Nocardioides sp. TF02-7]|uniref:SGNH/GDSL hydrolase family protein n=1 Tax=Nocardioides sp. TF02-7 TaxID=2917724 RepID=UPI001F05A5F0|nr:SGNH/GDSL hydrolase family protein [Nocardioides sp. TF02-7]UMG93591.1 SGNH/GDSL hydrolase family protein [Nocardioides sp. TF02-7]
MTPTPPGWVCGSPESWPSRLPGTVRVDGFSGSGFSRGASPCGDLSYARRAPRSLQADTALVVVEGGLNDVDQPRTAVVEGFEALMAAVGDRPVLVVGPVLAPARAGRVPDVDRLLSGLARRHGATYLSMVALDLPFLADGLHLTAEGHRLFGDHVARHVADLLG